MASKMRELFKAGLHFKGPDFLLVLKGFNINTRRPTQNINVSSPIKFTIMVNQYVTLGIKSVHRPIFVGDFSSATQINTRLHSAGIVRWKTGTGRAIKWNRNGRGDYLGSIDAWYWNSLWNNGIIL